MPGPRNDSFGYDQTTLEQLSRFTLEPVSPDEIADGLAGGESLVTVDVPAYLDRKLAVEVETGTGLYRLTQLFGLPNVPGFEAGGGAMERDRHRTTWQYLFTVDYEPRGGDDIRVPDSTLLSVYDYETDVSCGISGWVETDCGRVDEPVATPAEAGDVSVPSRELLELLVQLVLNVVEEPVPATYEGLWT